MAAVMIQSVADNQIINFQNHVIPGYLIKYCLCDFYMWSFEINTILAQRREFGILLAYGLSHRDIIKMVLIDNIKKMIIAILIMTCVIAGKLAANIMVENMTFYMLKNTIYSRLILTIGMIGILLVLLVCIVPSILLKKISPAELLGGK